jgi:putative methyltransferase (TIGR04325 family)
MHPILIQVKRIAKEIAPPFVHKLWQRSRADSSAEWVYEPLGWDTVDPKLTGWNVDTVARAEAARWPAFLATLSSADPMDTPHEAPSIESEDLSSHNTQMCFAYALARAAWHDDRASMLDWGGGVGHYYQIARALFPELALDYTCKDVPSMIPTARELQPTLRFVDSEVEAFDRQYDLVMASSSLHYSRDWTRVVHALARATRGFLYVTRLPLVEEGGSFVIRQRAHAYGYDTEYLGWCLNRSEFLDGVSAAGMRLEREFLIDERFPVVGAPRPIGCRGFLFRPA